jgi:L-ascorbate metabolism protein UlaG (beta-lactamase superfamily)
MNTFVAVVIVLFCAAGVSLGAINLKHDEFQTTHGLLKIYFVGHASLILEWNGRMIYVDPWSKLADYSKFPKAHLILITHHHPDHFDRDALAPLLRDDTHCIVTAEVSAEWKTGTVIKNGDSVLVAGVKIEAVPAYNMTSGRDKFHPKGRDNGYVLTIGGKRIYIAGDTENIPEMADLQNIDCAFLPMNQPYTMVPEQVAAAARAFHPKILYPYHYGETDCSLLQKLLADRKDIEVRIRPLR